VSNILQHYNDIVCSVLSMNCTLSAIDVDVKDSQED